MRTNFIILFVGIIFLGIATLFEVNYLDYKSPIPFSRINTITFKDFRGYNNPGLTLDGMTEYAFVCTNREISHLSDTTIDITTYFHPSRSYVYNKQIRSAELLTHELYHFRIAEYVSRLFRSDVKNGKSKISGKRLEELAEEYELLENVLQQQYDIETYHGYVLKEQRKWELDVDEKLVSLNSFSQTIISFSK